MTISFAQHKLVQKPS